ncbi:MAG: MBL fold metallo-hydrolase, partial [Planctomycetota bacterium]
LLVRLGNVELVEHAPGSRFALEPGLEVESVAVPHRHEYADTVAYRVRGGRRELLYLPDIDRWDKAPGAYLAGCDLALLDGTFFDEDELPRMRDVPHPPIAVTLSLLSRTDAEKTRFLHFNHTNRVLAGGMPGVPVAREGDVFDLG